MIYDVAVIGGGPSGASAAFHAAKQGLKTIIVEKENLPRYKTCGGGLVFRGRKNMPFELSDVVEREFKSVDIVFGAKQLAFNTKRESPIVTMIMRDAFDHLIVKKAQEHGVELLQGEALKELKCGEIATLKTSTQEIETKFVIAADGALSPTAKLAGWQETRMMCPALEYEIEVSDEDFKRLSASARFDIDAVPLGYGWCFPKKNHLSVGVGNFMKNKKNPKLKKYYKDYLNTIGVKNVLKSEAHGFIIPITPRSDGFVKGNVFLIGDAAGFADPVTAEGISNAIYSGKIVAKAIAESKHNLKQAEMNYNTMLNEKLLPELNTGVKLAKLFYENRTLRNLMLKKFGQHLADAMTDVFMGERTYPKDFKKSIKSRLKRVVF
ncbi:geranylgeranyl reductase family protein [Flavobacteriaceae bacterium 14752]|uniref:geranylgeranyl reductase family protein n=1 Tax=Mesohalobacter salilacus TaxID=2491711 RepID=UPI000F62E1E8|nr:geranylgeranyl reductase family protein [Flavobacteriaceae bacterium 14752]